jgi:biopolymer transport protein TolR
MPPVEFLWKLFWNSGVQTGMTTSTRSRAEINVTPMIDVLLVLLLIFMIIAPPKSAGLDARIPTPATEASNMPPRDIVVAVDENRAITINTQPVSLADLGDRLTQVFARRPDGLLFVAAAPRVDFQDVAHVMDIARGVGIDRVALMPREARSK